MPNVHENAIPDIPWRMVLPCLALLAIGLALYGPAIGYQFTYFDDRVLVVKDAAFITDWRNLPRTLATDVFRAGTIAYRPGLIISFMADAAWGGISAWAFHLSNILIHIGAACLLWYLLRLTGSGSGLALALAACFLVHPLQTQAVAWIPGRNDSLLGLFVLLSLIGFLRYWHRPGPVWLVVHFVAWAAALLVKEAAIALPAVCAVQLAVVLIRGRHGRRWMIFPLGWAAMGLVWFVARNHAININADVHPMVFNTLAENIYGFAGYVGKVFIPLRLSVLPVPHAADLWQGLAGLALLALLLLPGVRSRAMAATGLAATALFMAPHLMRGTSYPNYLEHRMYLPLAGICLVLGQATIWERVGKRRLLSAGLAVAIAAALAAGTARRLPVFSDTIALLNDAMEASPGIALPYEYLGSLYIDQEHYDIAEVYLDRARRMDPESKDVRNNLGVVYQSTGRIAQAEQAFLRGIAIAPRSSSLRYSLGLLYQQTGRMERAKAEYRKAIISRGDNVMALVNLGVIYQTQGQQVPAERSYRRALAVDRHCAQAWNNLGVIFSQRGMPDSARYYSERARREYSFQAR